MQSERQLLMLLEKKSYTYFLVYFYKIGVSCIFFFLFVAILAPFYPMLAHGKREHKHPVVFNDIAVVCLVYSFFIVDMHVNDLLFIA